MFHLVAKCIHTCYIIFQGSVAFYQIGDPRTIYANLFFQIFRLVVIGPNLSKSNIFLLQIDPHLDHCCILTVKKCHMVSCCCHGAGHRVKMLANPILKKWIRLLPML